MRTPSDIIGESEDIRDVRRLAAQVAPSDLTVLITGESGTGKELVAGEIHRQSARSERNFVRVNCAAITETLFESEFFGHRRGSFTGAIADRVGRFGEAEGGTLALDEIGVLKPEMQAKLLRVLETGEYQVVGESRTRWADVRIIAITNDDLTVRVKEGSFRSDLFYRLNVFPIRVPPLRERRKDIPLLAAYFLERARLGRSGPREGPLFDPDAASVLTDYAWPGNVRELRNVLERAVALAGGAPRPFGDMILQIAPAGETLELTVAENVTYGEAKELVMSAFEQRYLESLMERCDNNVSMASRVAALDRKQLKRLLRKHGLLASGVKDT
jgi:transcriptional regulator with GAF, ATPase, and Fis domain